MGGHVAVPLVYVYAAVCWCFLVVFWRYVVRWRCFQGAGLSALKRSCVVVSGCDYGFGLEIALRLHALGAVVFAGVLNERNGEALKRQVPCERMRPIVLNVRKQEDVDGALRRVAESGAPLLAVVNNAGISAFGWAESLPLSTYEANMDVNFLGTVRMTKAFLPLLRATKGRVVNMGSIGARQPSAFGSSYLTTKAAMKCYSDIVRQEVYRFGVHVSMVEPGFFATNLLKNASSSGETASTEDGVYPSFETKMKATSEMILVSERLNGSLDKVIDCVVDGITNAWPLAYYTVGYDARVIRHVVTLLPNWVIDVAQYLAC